MTTLLIITGLALIVGALYKDQVSKGTKVTLRAVSKGCHACVDRIDALSK